ncbi:uncharacterized protein LACBIDRAFT_322664 [Laccaria bicolor S238N-H82]|uniref:Predicted protein n=1 Tax=Laccaria bicolor (strain S238N-H82 / ATCC MYA-4686) TaxID=486041 RepID=B0CX37_LACBS|nr:uncharacterized protein LACBIDRAFT_322664 [Laccaria bicolor S238N-H82]EDR13183.1 predicted protein [Laccaria bicolor S238N-H82]|eukprot:XP_001875681.1 predicted protein [Laccaria bicolor S238N-H82]
MFFTFSPSLCKECQPAPNSSALKKAKVANAVQEDPPPALGNTTDDNIPVIPKCKSKVVAPRNPLPDRSNCVVNPGAINKPRPRRTSRQVVDDKTRKEQMMQHLAEIEQEKLELATQLELDEEEEAAEERCTSFSCLADQFDKDPINENEEFFMVDDFAVEDAPMDVDEELVTDVVEQEAANSSAKATKVAKKKKEKGDTRAAVDAVKEKKKANTVKSIKVKKGRPAT